MFAIISLPLILSFLFLQKNKTSRSCSYFHMCTSLLYKTNINLLNRLNEIDSNFIFMSSEETKTHERFLGKPIYTKTFKFDTILSNTVISKPHSISNVDNIWIDLSNSYMQAFSNGYSVPIVSNMYYGKVGSGNNWSVAVDKTSFYLYADSGWNDNWVKFITIRYTKTID